ncbi:M6 family metalloprotease domain-containing protein [Cellulomonas sp. PhB143]|uniref:M6 family metalloprotease domain-containing protein n=1 Tax=Cellulomonas sp. PhB143 TaxID=2485186 RepID=UPI000F4A59F2|nr:M6 family metalloprotease domain-containing protein [Cellulomonas sp. PhB143]ROS75310.1 immune inhibitor A [Cellulomonas sp. PhB143]
MPSPRATGLVHDPVSLCAVAPSPELRERLDAEVAKVRGRKSVPVSGLLGIARSPRPLGFDDGTYIPPSEFPLGTAASTIRSALLDRAPLRGSLRVIVVLVDFSDKHMAATADHFRELFFSTGTLATGSVRDYYAEASHGLVDLAGEVVGPYRMPHTLSWYANGSFGIARPSGTTRARDLARDALAAADAHVGFGPYDNDHNGYVDAFVVVHAGQGGEQTGNSGDIWSHKWVLPSEVSTDGTKVYAYLTIPEDAKIGVSAHELGHLVFGWPDLYDTDDTSEGVGNWCLMGGGSWNGGGDTPAHPSAWCKVNQGWASVSTVTSSGAVSVPDVKTGHRVHRLWKDGTSGPEYFLVENRQQSGFDAQLPGGGLLVWHIDENQSGNTDENHYKVGLAQADGARDLELAHNRGDSGDPFPGSGNRTSFTASTTPSSRSYAGAATCVSITGISAPATTMTATFAVSCGKVLHKELVKETKELRKDVVKETKELRKDLAKELSKDLRDTKQVAKETKDLKDRAEVKTFDRPRLPLRGPAGTDAGGAVGPLGAVGAGDAGLGLDALLEALAAVEERLAVLEAGPGAGGGGGEVPVPFIGADLRPTLVGQGDATADQALIEAMERGDASAKRQFDTLPPQV